MLRTVKILYCHGTNDERLSASFFRRRSPTLPLLTSYRIALAVTQLVSAKLSRGEKQEAISSDCPSENAKLIRSCWKKPKKRPDTKTIADNLYTLFTAAQSQPPLQPGLPFSTATVSVILTYVSNPLSTA